MQQISLKWLFSWLSGMWSWAAVFVGIKLGWAIPDENTSHVFPPNSLYYQSGSFQDAGVWISFFRQHTSWQHACYIYEVLPLNVCLDGVQIPGHCKLMLLIILFLGKGGLYYPSYFAFFFYRFRFYFAFLIIPCVNSWKMRFFLCGSLSLCPGGSFLCQHRRCQGLSPTSA